MIEARYNIVLMTSRNPLHAGTRRAWAGAAGLQKSPLVVWQVRQIRFVSWGSHWVDLHKVVSMTTPC
jgi:hypothetical protein